MAMIRTFRLSGPGATLLGLAVLLAVLALVALFVSGMVWVSQHLVWYIVALAQAMIVLTIVLFLPLAAFERTRRGAVAGLVAAAFVFGLATWMLGLIATFEAWGGLGVVIGLLLGGVGLVPLGMLAALFSAHWLVLGQLVVGCALTVAARWLARAITARMIRDAADRRARVIEGEIISRG